MRRITLMKAHFWSFLFWGTASSMVIALPIYATVISLPSKELVSKTVISSCPSASAANCLAAADLLQAVGSFYEIIIMILVALLAAAISLVYLSIRASSKRQIEQQLEKDVEAPWFQHQLQKVVEAAIEKTTADLALRLETLEKTVAKSNINDDSEAVTGSIYSNGDSSGTR